MPRCPHYRSSTIGFGPRLQEVTKVPILRIEPSTLLLQAWCPTTRVLIASAILLLKGKIHI